MALRAGERGRVEATRAVSREGPGEEAGAAGTAMIATVQQKLYPDMAACAKAWVDPHLGTSTKPNAGFVACYDKVFPQYVAARKAMRPVWQGLR